MNQSDAVDKEVRLLIKQVTAPSWKFWVDKEQALDRLADKGAKSRPAIDAISGLLETSDRSRLRATAACSLALICHPAGTVPEDPDPFTWPEVKKQMERFWETVNALSQDPRPDQQVSRAVRCLARSLGDSDHRIVEMCAFSLLQIGPLARESVDSLTPFTEGEHGKRMAMLARAAIANILARDDGTPRFLADIMLDGESSQAMRETASSCLLGLSFVDRREAFVPLLRSIERCSNAIVEKAITTLMQVMTSPRSKPTDAERAVPVLLKALQNDELAGTASGALVYAGPRAIPELVQALREAKSEDTRSYIARALGSFGHEALEALALLKEMRKLSDPYGLIGQSIHKIQRASKEPGNS